MTDKDLFDNELPRVGAPLFAERWSNIKAARIGYMVGRGLTAPTICEELADGSTPNMITAMTSFWGLTLHSDTHTHAPVVIELSAKHRSAIQREAKKRGVDVAELCQQVMVLMVSDKMWAAMLDK